MLPHGPRARNTMGQGLGESASTTGSLMDFQGLAMEQIVIVGASLAGLRAAEALREKGAEGSIVLVGDEARAPYDRPPLSKEILRGDWQMDRLALKPISDMDLGLDLRSGVAATRCDVQGRSLELSDGTKLPFDAMVIATGARARRLRDQPELEGIFTLRTAEDAMAIRGALTKGAPKVVVIGAGFIGAEVAASCRSLGLDVAMVEAAPTPMARLLPQAIGDVVSSLHRDQGVDLHLGVGVAGFEGEDRVAAVLLDDGSRIQADVVVVGVGATPATDWLESSGLTIDDGVVCDERCRAAPNIVAAGDCARWLSKRYGSHVRAEHWTNATDQAVAAADALLHGDEAAPYDPVPYVWSDQYKIKIQIAGRPRASDKVHIVHGSPEDLRFAALFSRGDQLTGCIGFRRARFVMDYLEILEGDASLARALEV